MPKQIKLVFLALSVAVILCVFLGVNARSVRAASDQPDGAYRQINVYSEVLQHIQTDYVEQPNIPAVTAGALRGLLESLDADSSYLSPADYKTYKAGAAGKAQVGINVSKRYGYAVVISVIPNGPADKSGLNDGDIIQAIGTMDTRDLSLAMIERLLQGTPGSQLTLAVVRPRKPNPDKFVLTRAVVAEPGVTETALESGAVTDLRPGVLDKEHVDALENKLRSAQKGGGRKIILDLRDVSTGEMNQGVRLANFFLGTGTLAVLQGQKVPKQTFTADPAKTIAVSSPLVVLVNHGTAGAAEIVAGAIAGNKRGEVVGERTFGEGSEKKTFELADGSALILSVAKYAPPSGKAFEDEGVAPTVTVTSTNDDADEDEDAPGAAAKPEPQPKRPAVQTDDQLNKALELLKAKAA